MLKETFKKLNVFLFKSFKCPCCGKRIPNGSYSCEFCRADVSERQLRDEHYVKAKGNGLEGTMKDTALKGAGVIFFLMAIAHLIRVVLKVEVLIGGVVLPVWASILAFIFLLSLSGWLFKSTKATM